MQMNSITSNKIMCIIIFNIMPSSIMLVAVVGSSSDTIFFFFNANSLEEAVETDAL